MDQTGALARTSVKPTVRTWDIFDTLIARRCIDPYGVFRVMAERTGLPDFVMQRVAAEERVQVGGRHYDLEMVHDELGRVYGLTPEQIAELRDLEVAVEHEMVIPIAEYQRLVRDGDVLVSDMYLGEARVRSLLEATGYQADTRLFISNHGKRNGDIWPQVLADYDIDVHTGDNPNGDIAVPRQFGIATRQTTSHSPNEIEGALASDGFRPLAEFCRSLRLMTWDDDPVRRELQLVQTVLNIPLLLLASVTLVEVARALGRRKLLFCARGTLGWMPIFEKVAERMGFDCEVEYFYTNRATRVKPSDDYLDYARSRLTDDAVIVDEVGSGWSTEQLVAKLGLRGYPVFFVQTCALDSGYLDVAPINGACDFIALVPVTNPPTPHHGFEMANSTHHAPTADVRRDGDGWAPVFGPDKRSEELLAYSQLQVDVMAYAAEQLDHYDLRDIIAASPELRRAQAQGLCGLIDAQQVVYATQQEAFFAEHSDAVRGMFSGPVLTKAVVPLAADQMDALLAALDQAPTADPSSFGAAEFALAWPMLIEAWRDMYAVRPPASERLLRETLNRGLATFAAVVDDLHLTDQLTRDVVSNEDTVAQLECAVVLLTFSGLFDEEGYRNGVLKNTPGVMPVLHYVTAGWPSLYSPRADFDVWWYWSEYLDVTRDDIDPFLFYALVGHRRGDLTRPAVVATTPAPPMPASPRRIALFAGYDKHGTVDQYVVDYLTDLAQYADIHYLADCEMKPGELEKLAGITVSARAYRHGRYDFGSYAELVTKHVGWDVIDGYDELILANDSAYLVQPFGPVFDQMDARDVDFWGTHYSSLATERRFGPEASVPTDEVPQELIDAGGWHLLHRLHMSSYFVAYRTRVTHDAGFRKRLVTVPDGLSYWDLVRRHEIGTFDFLAQSGYQHSSIASRFYFDLMFLSPRVFDEIKLGFPFLKRSQLQENPHQVADLDRRWREWIDVPGSIARPDVIQAHLDRVTDRASLFARYNS